MDNVSLGQRTHAVSYPQKRFGHMERRFVGVEEHVAVICPCCEAVDLDNRHARIRPRAGAQGNPHQLPLHAITRTLKRLGIPHQVESGEPFTADQSLLMDMVVRRGALQDAPNREYRDKSILFDVIHGDPQAHVYMRAGSAGHGGSAGSTSEARKRQRYARPDMCPLSNGVKNLPLWRCNALGLSMARKGVVK